MSEMADISMPNASASGVAAIASPDNRSVPRLHFIDGLRGLAMLTGFAVSLLAVRRVVEDRIYSGQAFREFFRYHRVRTYWGKSLSGTFRVLSLLAVR